VGEHDTAGHLLAVGATGMLAGAVETLAARSRTVTLVARGSRRLEALSARIRAAGAAPRALALDYREVEPLLAALRGEFESVGPVDRALLWIHGDAPRTPPALVALLEETSPGARVLLVLGSASADPSADLDARLAGLGARRIELRALVLGFAVEGGRSRWLSDDEISAAAVAALDGEERIRIAGTVRPWSARP
jgi:hypothetical protein